MNTPKISEDLVVSGGDEIFESPAGRAITEAMAHNPYVGGGDDESDARSTAFDLYLLNERDTLREGGHVSTDVATLIAGAQAWADDFWSEYQ